MPYVAGPNLLADDNQPGGDAGARLKGDIGSDVQRADRIEDGKAGPHGLLRVMLMSCRVAKIDEHAIAEELSETLANLQLANRTVLGRCDHKEPHEGGLAVRVAANIRRLFSLR